MRKLLFLLPIIIFFSNCKDNIEGCLNPEASNFDPSADESCCCEFPQLNILFSYNHYAADTTVFGLNSIYNDAGNNPYYINNINMYLSDFELVKMDNSIFRISDTLEAILQNGTIAPLIDDIIILKPSKFKYTIGTTITSGNFAKIRFKVGLNLLTNQTNPEEVATTHALSKSNNLYATNSYIFNKIDVVTDTSAINVITNFEITQTVVEIDLIHDFSIERGFDTELKINADLKKLLENVNFQTDSNSTIESKIIANVANIFTMLD